MIKKCKKFLNFLEDLWHNSLKGFTKIVEGFVIHATTVRHG